MNTKHADIVNYYDQAEIDYRLVWQLGRQLAMHYGFWDKKHRTLAAALKNENAVLAKLADIQATDHVLDAGCGVGGSSLYLAKHIGCQVHGISLSRRQVATASRAATKRKLSQLAQFSAEDFTATSFRDDSFDVVWAIESVCHADDRLDFLREAFRILKPGGRLIVADGFVSSQHLSPDHQKVMNIWLSGWSVKSLETLAGFGQKAGKVGFKSVHTQDYTAVVMPSAKRLYRLAQFGGPADWVTRKIGVRSNLTQGNFLAARYQYIALRQSLWQYGVVSALKP